MSDERILLDNLHGKVIALSALCITIATQHQDAETLLQLFKQELRDLQPKNADKQNNNYFLGIKEIHDRFELAVSQKKIDLPRMTHGKSGVEH